MKTSLKNKMNAVVNYVDEYRTPVAFAAGIAAGGAIAIYTNHKVDRSVLLQLSDTDMSIINTGDAARVVSSLGTIFIAKEIHLPS